LKSAFHRTAEELLSSANAWLVRHPKRIAAIVATLLLSGTGFSFAVANLAPDASQLPVRSIAEALTPPDIDAQLKMLDTQSLSLSLYRSDLTRSTDTAETLLKRLGIFDPQAASFLRRDLLAQKNLLGRVGRSVTAEAGADNTLLKLQVRWSPDEDGTFKRLSIEKTAKGFDSRLESLPLTASSRMASGTIVTSLFAATDAARIPDSVSNQLADIFSSEIDFHRALHAGDRFSVVYETLEGDGEPMHAGRILSAEFVNGGKTHQAMWFQDAGSAVQGAAKGGYYTLAGESLKHAFLAAPLAFSRITSGFKMRFHPILQVWKAHLGVDYAAPMGTAVRSVGDGVVEFAGSQSGYGNVVKIRHANQISTVYAHLSRINVRQGQSVPQGQLIGAVGMTGWATGPHLHFEYRLNGVYQDPQVVARRNDTVPLSASARPLFDRAAIQARVALAAAGQVQLSSVE
jgi:murein DD-endopeptidase MepM/ murein hydrolase activator NlpD